MELTQVEVAPLQLKEIFFLGVLCESGRSFTDPSGCQYYKKRRLSEVKKASAFL